MNTTEEIKETLYSATNFFREYKSLYKDGLIKNLILSAARKFLQEFLENFYIDFVDITNMINTLFFAQYLYVIDKNQAKYFHQDIIFQNTIDYFCGKITFEKFNNLITKIEKDTKDLIINIPLDTSFLINNYFYLLSIFRNRLDNFIIESSFINNYYSKDNSKILFLQLSILLHVIFLNKTVKTIIEKQFKNRKNQKQNLTLKRINGHLFFIIINFTYQIGDIIKRINEKSKNRTLDKEKIKKDDENIKKYAELLKKISAQEQNLEYLTNLTNKQEMDLIFEHNTNLELEIIETFKIFTLNNIYSFFAFSLIQYYEELYKNPIFLFTDIN